MTATVYIVRQCDVVTVTVQQLQCGSVTVTCVHSDSVTMSVYTATMGINFDGVHSHSVAVSLATWNVRFSYFFNFPALFSRFRGQLATVFALFNFPFVKFFAVPFSAATVWPKGEVVVSFQCTRLYEQRNTRPL